MPLAVPMLTRQTAHRGNGFLQLGQDCSFTCSTEVWRPGQLSTLLAAPPERERLPVLPTLGRPLYQGETDLPQ